LRGPKASGKTQPSAFGGAIEIAWPRDFPGNSDRGLLRAGVNRTGCRSAPLPVLVPQHGNFLPSGLELVLVTGGTTMKKPDWSPRQDLDARATQAVQQAQNLPPGPQRIEAMKKADGLRHAADTYNYRFSCELKPPD